MLVECEINLYFLSHTPKLFLLLVILLQYHRLFIAQNIALKFLSELNVALWNLAVYNSHVYTKNIHEQKYKFSIFKTISGFIPRTLVLRRYLNPDLKEFSDNYLGLVFFFLYQYHFASFFVTISIIDSVYLYFRIKVSLCGK